ncbi:MAG: NTP transferase domain-containing protein [Deltaproteobacteria bacterium]|nr:NTP transferase domain-containing protein [Deltaproteobacteria bacterium]
MKAGIIAAGQGERLARAGVHGPKPLVRVGGLPLIAHTLNGIRAAGIAEVACIINEDSAAVAAYCHAQAPDLSFTFVHRSTPSSMESLFALAPHLDGESFLLLTVDAIIAPAAVGAFARAAAERADADGVLALNDFVDDEKPLRVRCDNNGRITAIGAAAADSPLITAGFYTLRPAIFAEIEAARAAGLSALRQFLGHLIARGYRLYGQPVPKCVDVDRAEDIVTAEAFIRSGYTA